MEMYIMKELYTDFTFCFTPKQTYHIWPGSSKWSKLSVWWMPKLLYPDHLYIVVKLSLKILSKWNQVLEAFLRGILTEDLTWYFHYCPEDIAQSKQWHQVVEWFGQSRSGRVESNIMATALWDAHSILLVKLLLC